MSRLTIADKILIALILLGSTGFLTAKMYARSSKSYDNRAIVYLDNKKVGEFPLNEPRTIKLRDIKLRVKDNSIFVLENTCQKQYCRHGSAAQPGDTIICMPKRLYIDIEGTKRNYDSVTM